MTQGAPIDRRHPASLALIEMHHTFGPQLIRLAVIVRVVGVEGQDETFLEPDLLATSGRGACQHK